MFNLWLIYTVDTYQDLVVKLQLKFSGFFFSFMFFL